MKTLVLGDSWASAIEADTGRDAGWPEIMGIPSDMRQAVAGSTAAEWAADKDGRLTRAINTEADAVIISLMGNDGRHAMSDGVLTIAEMVGMVRSMRRVVDTLQRSLTVVLLYADPYSGRDDTAAMGVSFLNSAIRWACRDLPVTFVDTGDWLTQEHFDGKDFHPTRAGHEVIAAHIAEILPGV